jgi:hypothetical protein
MCWGRALVTSDTDVLRDFFEEAAIYTRAEGAEIAAAIREGLASERTLRAAMVVQRGRQDDRQLHQISALRANMKSRM